jgi:class 3 adenylate cyclase
VLLVTDLEGFTPLLARLGDLQARPIMRAHDRALRECLRAHRGRTVVHTGDGVIAAFRSVNNALACAAHMQRRFAAPTDPQGVLLRLRIGIHAGEPLAERGRLFGLCVNMAVRICKTAPAGSVWVSDLVRECAACDVGNFRSRGLFPLKGFDEPASLHELICERVLAPSRFAVRTPA